MPVKTFKKLEEIPEEQRESAIETKAGTFLLVEDADTSEIETAAAEEKTKRLAAEAATRKVQAALQKLETQRKAADAGLTEERLKEIQADAKAQAEAEYKERVEAGEKAIKRVGELTRDRDVRERAIKAGLRPEKVEDFMALRGAEFDLTTDEKTIVKSQPTADVDKHVTALLKKNPEWIVGTKANGGGAGGTTTGTGGAALPDNMSPIARLEAAHAAGMTE